LYGLKAASETRNWINVIKRPKHEFPDEHLFRQEMQDVVPLNTPATTDSKASRTPYARPRSVKPQATEASSLLPSVDDRYHIDEKDGSSHRKNGVQKRIIQKLKRGQFPISDQLDLHHMSLETGQAALLEFITGAQRGTLACVRVIHGKGLRSVSGPRLKLMTRLLLRDHPEVLAFTTCKPVNGGSGAVDVLLKKL